MKKSTVLDHLLVQSMRAALMALSVSACVSPQFGLLATDDGGTDVDAESPISDTGTPQTDARTPDTGVADANVPDANAPEANVPDANVPDTSPDVASPLSDLTVSVSGTGNVTSDDGNISCGTSSACSKSYSGSPVVTLAAAAGVGSLFTGWGGACSGTATTCTITMSSSQLVYATFNLPQTRTLNVSVDGTGGGSVSSAPAGVNCSRSLNVTTGDCTESYVAGTQVTLTASPNSSSTFQGWSGGGCSGTGACSVSLASSQTVTATFAQNQHTLSVTAAGTGNGSIASTPGGISCALTGSVAGGDCSEAYDEGTAVTLTATAGSNTTFVGWSGGGCTGTGTCSVTLSSATSVNATFKVVDRGVLAYATIMNTGSVDGSMSYNSAGSVTASKTATGTYSVTFSGLSISAANVMVTPRSAANCVLTAASGSTATIKCYSASTTPTLTDNWFHVGVFGAVTTATAGRIVGATYVKAGGGTQNSYNFGAGAVTATVDSSKYFTINFEGLSLGWNVVPHVQSMSAGVYCWASLTDASTKSTVWGACYSGAGTRVDAALSVTLTASASSAASSTFTIGGYVWADQSTSTSKYAPTYGLSLTGQPITVERVSAGSYKVALTGVLLTASSGITKVTASASDRGCVPSWSSGSDYIMVNCTNPFGSSPTTPADATFSLQYYVR